jgi:hypothetical protein
MEKEGCKNLREARCPQKGGKEERVQEKAVRI